MPSYNATGQPDPTVPNNHVREHCTVNANDLSAIQIQNGQQVRIERSEGEVALYTIIATNATQGFVQVGFQAPENVHHDLSKRLGLTDDMAPFMCTVNSQVVSNLSDAEAPAKFEFVERLEDDGVQTEMIAIAPHGAKIEPYTDQQADQVYAKLNQNFKCVSKWLCKGWEESPGEAFQRWHITETDINEKSFPELNKVINRKFKYAVAFHGWSYDCIGIGGLAPLELKNEVKNAIINAVSGSGIGVFTDEDPGFANCFPNQPSPPPLTGTSPKNILNRLSPGGGIQIEQSLAARKNYWKPIANSVAGVLDPLLPVCGKQPVTVPILGGVAIDPLSLILSGTAYLIVAEARHPHVPNVADIAAALRVMGPEEQKAAVARAKTLAAAAKAVIEAAESLNR